MEKIKKIPQRKCMGCMQVFPKSELLRVVRTPSGAVLIDTKGKLSGRGAYICKNSTCFKKAIKAKRIQQKLQVELTEDTVAQLEEELHGEK